MNRSQAANRRKTDILTWMADAHQAGEPADLYDYILERIEKERAGQREDKKHGSETGESREDQGTGEGSESIESSGSNGSSERGEASHGSRSDDSSGGSFSSVNHDNSDACEACKNDHPTEKISPSRWYWPRNTIEQHATEAIEMTEVTKSSDKTSESSEAKSNTLGSPPWSKY
jgi:hypothetical protein